MIETRQTLGIDGLACGILGAAHLAACTVQTERAIGFIRFKVKPTGQIKNIIFVLA